MFTGGWSDFRALSSEDESLFKDTMTLKGVDYKPFTVATHLVKG